MLETVLRPGSEARRKHALVQGTNRQLARWEVFELKADGRIIFTAMWLRGTKVLRFTHTYDPLKDKEQYDQIVREHGPFIVGKASHHEVWNKC
jgi:hypothetical protein